MRKHEPTAAQIITAFLTGSRGWWTVRQIAAVIHKTPNWVRRAMRDAEAHGVRIERRPTATTAYEYRINCGWSASGNDGRAELVEMGETIDEE